MSLKPNKITDLLKAILLALITSGLLSIAFLDADYYLLTWFAFVPMLFALQKASYLKIYCLSLLAGTCAYMGGIYWIVDFIQISKGFGLKKSLIIALLYWFYCGHLIALLFLSFKWIQRKTQWHSFIIFPVVLVTFTSAYPMLFSMRLGDSQTKFLSAIQAIEFVGVYGLDALIALVNVVLFHFVNCLISHKKSSLIHQKIPFVLASLIVAVWFSVGNVQLSNWTFEMQTWNTVKIGIVQPNEVPKLGKRTVYPGYSIAYSPEMEMSKRLNNLGAQLIVWPEAQTKEYLNNDNVRYAYQNQVREMRSTLLFQDSQNEKSTGKERNLTQISAAVLLDENGQQKGLYQKIKRIPFGESIPFFKQGSVFHKWLRASLGEFYVELIAGQNHAVFQSKELNIIPLICYETTFPDFVASAVENASKSLNETLPTVLIALTNDGWFGSTHQPYQHVMPSVLRAVENRLPLIHVANNGPSIVVMPNGEVIFQSDFQQAGGYLVDMPSSPIQSSTFYSRHPNVFDRTMFVIFIMMMLIAFVLSNKKTK